MADQPVSVIEGGYPLRAATGGAPPFPFQPDLQTANPAAGANDVRYRDPVPADDTARGFAVGDYWHNLATSRLYRATAVAAGAAVWADVTPMALPYDALVAAGGAAQGAYGVRKMVAAYGGPCIRVRRDDDRTEQDIGFDGAGRMDVVALAAFIGAPTVPFVSPSLGSVRTWYDQSGFGNHAVAPTETATAQWPKIHIEQLIGGAPAIQFEGLYSGGQYSRANEYLVLPNGITGTQTSASIMTASRTPSAGRNTALAQIGVTATTAAVALQSYTGSGNYTISGAGSGKITGTRVPMVNAAVGGVVAASGPGASRVYYDGSIATGTWTGTTALAGGYLGAIGTAAATRGNAELGCAMVASTAWTQAQWDAAERATILLYRIYPQVRDTLCLDGDSFVDGQRSTCNRTIGRRLEAGLLARPMRVVATGISGQRLTQRIANHTTLSALAVTANATNIFVSQASTNDIAFEIQWTPGVNAMVGNFYYNYGCRYECKTGGVCAYDTGPTGTAAGITSGAASFDYTNVAGETTIYGRMATLLGLAKGSGYGKALVVTTHPRGDRDAVQTTMAENLVSLIRGNAQGFDRVIDTAGDSFGLFHNRDRFWSDSTHPLEPQMDRMARIYAWQINAALTA